MNGQVYFEEPNENDTFRVPNEVMGFPFAATNLCLGVLPILSCRDAGMTLTSAPVSTRKPRLEIASFTKKR